MEAPTTPIVIQSALHAVEPQTGCCGTRTTTASVCVLAGLLRCAPTSLGDGRCGAGRQVYFHLDCEVLEPGIVATDYVAPHGLSLQDLHDVAIAVAAGTLLGVELGEYEGPASADVGPCSMPSRLSWPDSPAPLRSCVRRGIVDR